MKKSICLLAFLALSNSALAEVTSQRVIIPAREILRAAKEIKPQTGPAYFVAGHLYCVSRRQEEAPFEVTSTCTVSISGAQARLRDARGIMNAVREFRPEAGLTFKAIFHARSIHSEMPPYDVSEFAALTFD